MTKMLLIMLVAAGAIGCENLHQTVRPGTILGATPPGQPALLLGNHAFTDFEGVKTYVRALPAGAILYWDTSSLGMDRINLPQADLTVSEFSKFCRQNGTAFQFLAPQKPASTVFVLRPSGFATFCDILSSAAPNDPNTQQLFAECQVAYAGGLQPFFEKAGVPFPPKTSIEFNRENNWLIVYNTPENQALISRIVWSYQTPDFDEKMRCLAGHVKARQLVR